MKFCADCQQTFDPDLLDCPSCGGTATAASTGFGVRDLPMAARIAGGILVVSALLGSAIAFLKPELAIDPVDSRSVGSWMGIVLSGLLDLVLGAVLLYGARSILKWCIFRALMGATVIPAFLAFQGQWLQGGFQLWFCVALLLLLVGRAGLGRTIAGTCMAALLLLLLGTTLLSLLI